MKNAKININKNEKKVGKIEHEKCKKVFYGYFIRTAFVNVQIFNVQFF